jgi:hypothetical protein
MLATEWNGMLATEWNGMLATEWNGMLASEWNGMLATEWNGMLASEWRTVARLRLGCILKHTPENEEERQRGKMWSGRSNHELVPSVDERQEIRAWVETQTTHRV